MSNAILVIILSSVGALLLLLLVWSYLADPSQFIKALNMRIQIIFAKFFISIYGVGKRIIIPTLYIIFDPILIFIDDVIVGFIGIFSIYYYLKKQFFKSLKDAAPFPKPWRR